MSTCKARPGFVRDIKKATELAGKPVRVYYTSGDRSQIAHTDLNAIFYNPKTVGVYYGENGVIDEVTSEDFFIDY